ncbi:hypothetical protein VNI00_007021 [Paramarasmius palmivorus]|uniref:TPR-like protein n=1 Tax=Paramarasmius palmivorus TaxID=297713 RepID=A0AAW0D464_9AGAR
MSSAQALKEEADALFRQQDYQAALLKYHEAIKIDDKNPVLSANSALCALKLEYYLDVIYFATLAIKLDRTYVKAYTYLAKAQSAIHQYSESEKSWQNVTKALPLINLTPQEIALKHASEQGCAECRKHIRDVKAQVEGKLANTREYPVFRRVAALTEHMSEEEIDQPSRSHCHVARVTTIYLQVTKSIQALMHKPIWFFESECALTDLVKVVQHDARVAHNWDVLWPEKIYNMLETMNGFYDGWKDLKPDEHFRNSVQERIAQKVGLNRRALGVTVKCWIVHAMMLESPGSEKRAEYLRRAIEVIKWARSVISLGDVNDDILKPTFLLATQKLYLSALVLGANEKRNDVATHAQLLSDILQQANEVIEVANSISRDEHDEVHAVAYQDFPCGMAWAAKGYYYWEQAMIHRSSQPALQHYLRMASEHYLKASTYFPEDDEYHDVSGRR